MEVKKYLLRDIEHLSNHDISKLYKYIRRYLIAEIDGLVDPLEPTKEQDVCTGKVPVDKIREAFEEVYEESKNFVIGPMPDIEDMWMSYQAGHRLAQAEIERLKAENEAMRNGIIKLKTKCRDSRALSILNDIKEIVKGEDNERKIN